MLNTVKRKKRRRKKERERERETERVELSRQKSAFGLVAVVVTSARAASSVIQC